MTNHRPLRTKGLSVFLVVLMLASPVGSSIALAADAGVDQEAIGSAGQSPTAFMNYDPITLDDSSVVEVREGVSMWDQAIFPLRAIDSYADHSSRNTGVFVGVEDGTVGETDLWKESLSVYNKDEKLNLTYSIQRTDLPETSGGADTVDNARVQLIAARLDGDEELPQSQAALAEVITDNDSATFTTVTDRDLDLDNRDDLGWTDEFEFTPTQSGQYVLFLAAPENADEPSSGFSTPDGDLARSGHVTIIGMDSVTVHEASSTVEEPSNPTQGENATFDVKTSDVTTASEVNHTVVLYDEANFKSRTTTFTATNVSTDAEVSVETDIKSINGEVYLINEPSIQNVDLSDEELSLPLTATTIADMIATDRDNITTTEDAVQLDASMTAKRGAPNTDLDVGIPSNWSDGDYHWIHVATTADGSVVGSNSGDFSIGADDSSGDDDDDDDRRDRRNNRDNNRADVDVKKDNGKVTVTITNAGANERVRITTNTTGSGPASPVLDELNASFTESTSATLSVSGDRGSTPPVSSDADLGYFNISHDVPDETTGPVTFSFRVSSDRLAERGVSADDVQLYRYHDGEWTPLDTRHLGSSNGDERFEADSPGLSVFAVSTRNAQAATFEVTDASVDATSVSVGDSVEVTATVENTGNGEGTYTAELVIDGETVAQQDVTVAAGGSETVTFTHSFDATGNYEVAVGDTTAGTVEVTGGDTTTTTSAVSETPGEGQGGNLPILIVFVLLVIVGAVAYLFHSGRLDEYR